PPPPLVPPPPPPLLFAEPLGLGFGDAEPLGCGDAEPDGCGLADAEGVTDGDGAAVGVGVGSWAGKVFGRMPVAVCWLTSFWWPSLIGFAAIGWSRWASLMNSVCWSPVEFAAFWMFSPICWNSRRLVARSSCESWRSRSSGNWSLLTRVGTASF